jgi:hypothetical protein
MKFYRDEGDERDKFNEKSLLSPLFLVIKIKSPKFAQLRTDGIIRFSSPTRLAVVLQNNDANYDVKISHRFYLSQNLSFKSILIFFHQTSLISKSW